MARGAPFTDAERQAIIASYPRRSIREIAADTGRSYSGIRYLLTAAGVPLRPMGGRGGRPRRKVAA